MVSFDTECSEAVLVRICCFGWLLWLQGGGGAEALMRYSTQLTRLTWLIRATTRISIARTTKRKYRTKDERILVEACEHKMKKINFFDNDITKLWNPCDRARLLYSPFSCSIAAVCLHWSTRSSFYDVCMCRHILWTSINKLCCNFSKLFYHLTVILLMEF